MSINSNKIFIFLLLILFPIVASGEVSSSPNLKFSEVKKLVKKYLARISSPDLPLAINKEMTLEKSSGWVIIY